MHEPDVLRARMCRHKLNTDEYQWYLYAFDYGISPHGGYGLRLERLTECIVVISHVRHVTLLLTDVRRTSL